MNSQTILFIIYAGLLVLMSLISFFLYGNDKKRAEKGKRRIKEKTLLLTSCYNGAIGSFIGRIAFRHKTGKGYFTLVIFLSLMVQIAAFLALGYLAFFAK